MSEYVQNLPSVIKAASYQMKVSDADKIFTNLGAGGTVTFTLPPIAEVYDGWSATFIGVVASQNIAVTAPTGKLVGFNNAAATTITFQTAGNLIGAAVKIVYVATIALYVAIAMGPNTVTMS